MAEEQKLKVIHKTIQLNGKCITADDPTQIGTNFQTLKNLRPYGNRLRGISGQSLINSAGAIPTYLKIRSGIQYINPITSKSHILTQAWDTNVANPRVLENKNNLSAVPATNTFGTTVLYTPASGAGNARWSQAPNGQVAYCDGVKSCIWGGDENRVPAFLVESTSTAFTTFTDYTEIVNNDLTDSTNVATINLYATNYILIGSTRPLGGTLSDGTAAGIKFYVGTANTTAATMAIQYWDGDSFEAVGGASDGTLAGGKTLAQTGIYSFNDTTSVVKTRILFNRLLYWYLCYFSAQPSAGTTVSRCTVFMPFQPILDIWDGVERSIDQAWFYSSGAGGVWEDVTTAFMKYEDTRFNDSTVATYYDLNAVGNSSYFLIGSVERLSGFVVKMTGTPAPATASTITVSYWSGTAWTTVGASLVDGTSNGTINFKHSGNISWTPPAENLEFTTSNQTQVNLFYYKIGWSAQFSANQCRIDYIGCIPASKTIHAHKFPMLADNSLWLCGNLDDVNKKNSVLVSAPLAPDVYNGETSSELDFGNTDELMVGANLYSRLAGNIYDIKVMFKRKEMYGVMGSTAKDYQKFNISQTIGCVAPETLKNAFMQTEGGMIPILIWQAIDGIYVYDNTAPIPISDDIKNFFDDNESASRKLHASYKEIPVGFVDFVNMEYHWLFADGNSTGTLNREWVFNLKKRQWFEIDRVSSAYLQYGIEVYNSLGSAYNFGFIDTGFMVRLENGNNFVYNTTTHNDITFTLQTGDFLPAESVLHLTRLLKERLICIAKSSAQAGGSAQNIAKTHYGDGSTTGISLSAVSPILSGKRIAQRLERTILPSSAYTFHSLKYEITTDDETWGFEPLLIGTKFEITQEVLD